MTEYYVFTKDYYGKEVKIKVATEVHQLFEEDRRMKERLRSERRRHLDFRTLDDYGVMNQTAKNSMEDIYLQRESLKSVSEILRSCTPVQQERFYLNRICGYNYAEIAEMQGCAARRVGKSIEAVMKKIKKVLQEGAEATKF